jgi:hypothetical protein
MAGAAAYEASKERRLLPVGGPANNVTTRGFELDSFE